MANIISICGFKPCYECSQSAVLLTGNPLDNTFNLILPFDQPNSVQRQQSPCSIGLSCNCISRSGQDNSHVFLENAGFVLPVPGACYTWKRLPEEQEFIRQPFDFGKRIAAPALTAQYFRPDECRFKHQFRN